MKFPRHAIVLIPVPYAGSSGGKIRPCIVVGGWEKERLFVVPITSKLPAAAFRIVEWRASGLEVPSGVLPRVYTARTALADRQLGTLGAVDIETLNRHLQEWFGLAAP